MTAVICAAEAPRAASISGATPCESCVGGTSGWTMDVALAAVGQELTQAVVGEACNRGLRPRCPVRRRCAMRPWWADPEKTTTSRTTATLAVQVASHLGDDLGAVLSPDKRGPGHGREPVRHPDVVRQPHLDPAARSASAYRTPSSRIGSRSAVWIWAGGSPSNSPNSGETSGLHRPFRSGW